MIERFEVRLVNHIVGKKKKKTFLDWELFFYM